VQLTKRDVVGAAIVILDEYGLGDLTMRRLATSLNVAAGALYWHFPNKQALLGAVADRILEPVTEPGAGPWDEQLAQVAHAVRDALLAHRDAAEIVSAAFASRLTTSNVPVLWARSLRAGGISAADAELAATALLYYVLGHTIDEQSRIQMDSSGALEESASPLFETPTATDRFNFGLNLFIAGARQLTWSGERHQ
jgi:TetR/AcrR family tetracycline transcriptional repressor